MPLIDCPECGGKISDQASTCPHCGCPKSQVSTDREVFERLIVFVVFVKRVVSDIDLKGTHHFDDLAWNCAIASVIEAGRLLLPGPIDYWVLVHALAEAARLCKAGRHQEAKSILEKMKQDYNTMVDAYKDMLAQ
jgi:hypothetical protein